MTEPPIQSGFPKTSLELSEDQWRTWVLYHHWKRTLISNERKLIAWLRTSLTLVTLGFIVERIELFLRETGREAGVSGGAFSPIAGWIAPLFFVLGALVTLFGTLDFFGDRRRIRLGDMARSNLLDALVIATLIVVVVSALLFLFPIG